MNHDLYFFWVSSLAYPNLLGKKGYVVVVVVVVVVEYSEPLDLKDWNISKEIALDRSAWRLAINVPEP